MIELNLKLFSSDSWSSALYLCLNIVLFLTNCGRPYGKIFRPQFWLNEVRTKNYGPNIFRMERKMSQ